MAQRYVKFNLNLAPFFLEFVSVFNKVFLELFLLLYSKIFESDTELLKGRIILRHYQKNTAFNLM